MSSYVECEQKIKDLTEKRNQLQAKIATYESLQQELARYRFAAYDKSRSGKIIGIGDKVAYKKVKQLEKQLVKLQPLPSVEEIKAIDIELEKWSTQLKYVPKIIQTSVMSAKISGRWSYNCQDMFTLKLSDKKKWFAYSSERVMLPYTYEVITNEKNIPIQVKRFLKNSDTFGYLWCWIYDIKLEVLPTEDIIPIVEKPIEPTSKVMEGTTMAIMGTQVKTVSELTTKIKICPYCEKPNRPVANYCQNCAKDISKVPLTDKKPTIEKDAKGSKAVEDLKRQRERKKKGIFGSPF